RRTPRPGTAKSGRIRSPGVTVVSRTIRRSASVRRSRRGRYSGNFGISITGSGCLRRSGLVPGLEALAHDDRVLDRGGVVVGPAADLLEAVSLVEVPGDLVGHADLEEQLPDAALAHVLDHGIHQPLRDPAPPVLGRDRDVAELALIVDGPARRVADDPPVELGDVDRCVGPAQESAEA